MDVRVREATADDAAVISELNQRLALETEGKRLDPAVISAGVRRGLGQPELCRYFVAEVDGDIVGQTMITYELSDWRDGLLWWIQSVFVRQPARGGRVFGALYRHIEEAARRDADARGLRLYVHVDNVTAMEVYERLGMERSRYVLYEVDFG